MSDYDEKFEGEYGEGEYGSIPFAPLKYKAIVEIYVVDPDEAVAIEKSLIHYEKILTDDSEEALDSLDWGKLLDAHNTAREALDLPAITRQELKSRAVTIATF